MSDLLKTNDLGRSAEADGLSSLRDPAPTGLAHPASIPSAAQLDDAGYLWKWVERGLYDTNITAREALSMIAHHPAAPWKQGRWDVDHKEYATRLYADFPRAAQGGVTP